MEINTRVFIFARDVATREEVKEYFDEYIKETILQRAFAMQDTKDLAEAQKIIDGVFSKMQHEVADLSQKDFVNENE